MDRLAHAGKGWRGWRAFTQGMLFRCPNATAMRRLGLYPRNGQTVGSRPIEPSANLPFNRLPSQAPGWEGRPLFVHRAPGKKGDGNLDTALILQNAQGRGLIGSRCVGMLLIGLS